ncbi:MAG: hypothetical protein IJ506_06025 [Clostridia bacterium]|nr:hypothetical protein [Clostridia bacterium]
MKKRKNTFLACLLLSLISLFVFFGACDPSGGGNAPSVETQKSIAIKEESVEMILGETYQLDVSVVGVNESALSWTSDEKIVVVSNGKLVATGVGSTSVTVQGEGYQDTCVVNVSLGEITPVLQFENTSTDVVLLENQTFEIYTYVNFNNEKYTDHSLTVECDESKFSYELQENVIVLTTKAKTDASELVIKASWNGSNADAMPTLTKSFIITVKEEVYFVVNGGGINDITLYSNAELGGNTYQTQEDFLVEVYKNTSKVENATVEVSVADENVAVYADGKVSAVGKGETVLTVKYSDGVSVYENQLSVKVLFPTATRTNDTFRRYSISDNKFELDDLGLSLENAYAVEINGVKLDVTDGEMPAMTLVNATAGVQSFQHNEKYVLQLSVDGLSKPITLNQSNNGKDFDAVKMSLHMNSGYIYELTNVHVYSRIINDEQDFAEIFGNAGKLEGYYVLGDHIDASAVTLTGAKRKATDQFTGLFDGMGYTVSNLDLSTTTADKGSLFGALLTNAAVRNVAFINVKANGASVIAATAAYNKSNFGGYPAPMISNVYVQVSSDTNDFYGIVGGGPNYAGGHVTMKNVIVEYAGTITGDDTTKAKGAFVGYKTDYLTEASMVCSDCYLISAEYITTLNNTEVYPDTDIARYDTVEAMKAANNDYSSFNYCWTVVGGGIPVWTKMQGVTIVTVDTVDRAYSIADGTLDLSGLNFSQADITAVEINGVKLDVANGVFPAMTLVHTTPGASNFQHNEAYTLELTISGIDTPITLTRSATDKDFSAITLKVYTELNDYTLKNVHVYNKVLKNADDLTALFGSDGALSGYYVLGGHIDASSATLTGAKRANQWFTGIFDGKGYTISNLDVSSNAKVGSLFGLLYLNGAIKNVAFTNVKANGSSVIAANAQYGKSDFGGYPAPMISNVYVQVSSDTNDFYGIVGGGPRTNVGHAIMKNVIVEYAGTITGDDTTTAKGAFVGYKTEELTATAMVCSDCYLISTEYITTLNNAEVYPDTDIARYDTVEAMKAANNDYSSFNDCWTVVGGGIPVWKNLPAI